MYKTSQCDTLKVILHDCYKLIILRIDYAWTVTWNSYSLHGTQVVNAIDKTSAGLRYEIM